MASRVPTVESHLLSRPTDRVRLPAWTAAAWGAIGATIAFFLITCWWLIVDRSIPIFDAGLHLSLALSVHHELMGGHIGKALTLSIPYPPLTYLVASAGFAVGGVGVTSAVIAENLVFVTLLALGCYHVGRLAFNPAAGFLAVVFALFSPLIISLFHVVMIDGPETAMVAVTLWAILETKNFSRVGTSAIAGLLAGLGMLTKEPFAFFIAGPVLVALCRGGWKQWRGLIAFGAGLFVIALPWYIPEFRLIRSIGTGALASPTSAGLTADIAPHAISFDNFEWYDWNLINVQLLLPLFLFSAVGWIWTIIGFIRRRPVSAIAPELAVGAFVGWLGITETFAHDTRYSLPLLVYLAVFAGGWIVRLPRRAGVVAATLLILVATWNTVGIIFGAGGVLRFKLPGANLSYRQNPGVITVFSNGGFLAGVPSRDGDLLSTLRALKHHGVQTVVVEQRTLFEPDFSDAGVSALAQIAGLEAEIWEGGSPTTLTSHDAVLLHLPLSAELGPPCLRLSDDTGVWITLGDPAAKGARYYCPTRRT